MNRFAFEVKIGSSWKNFSVVARRLSELYAPRSGRKKTISADKERAIVKATLETKPANGTHWSTRSMATAQGK